jgi:glutamine synthetase
VSANVELERIDWVRLGFVDVFGTSNSVQIPAARFHEVLSHGAPFDGSALEGRARYLESDMLLHPDPATLVDVGSGIARVVCTAHTPDGTRWPGDPRYALESLLDELSELAAGMTVAAELEFYLLDDDAVPVDFCGYFDEAESPGSVLTRSVAERLIACGIPVDGCHHEAGPGQYELDLAPLGPMHMADGLILAKQTIRDVATGQGMRATFMPRPFDDQPGSGLHLHQRLGGRVVDDAGQLEAEGRGFVAGQLAHARGLSALAAPTVNSYKRLHAAAEAPDDVVWAHTNRGALLRVSSYRGPDASIEYRGADPSANPYLLFTGLLASGVDGIEQDLELPSPVEETSGGYDPAASSQVLEPLPRNLDEALDSLAADDLLVDVFDNQLLARFIDGRRAEAQAYRSLVTGWERTRYLDEA